MEILYTVTDFPEPGDRDLLKGIDEINKGRYKNALQYFEKSSKYGNEYAMLITASIYFMGFDIERDPKKAVELYTSAATEWNNSAAQYFLGIMHLDGDGVDQNDRTALKWLTQAATNGWSIAQAHLAFLHQKGYGCFEKNHEKSTYWYEKVALEYLQHEDKDDFYLFGNQAFVINFNIEISNVVFQEYLSVLGPCKFIFPTEIVASNINRFDRFHYAAHTIFWYTVSKQFLTVAFCHTNLATIYNTMYNSGIPIDEDNYLYGIRKAAKNGDPDAQYLVGLNYEVGTIVTQDYREALRWYAKSRNQGNKDALCRIASLYYFGHGVDRDHITALSFLELYINHVDHGNKYYIMGTMYERGEGVLEVDYTRAIVYYHKAVYLGVDSAAAQIGLIYLEGRDGVTKDYKKAYEWLSKADEMENPSGQFSLGSMYLNGIYVGVNLNRALKLFKKAYKGGFKKPALLAINQVEIAKQAAVSMRVSIPKGSRNNLID